MYKILNARKNWENLYNKYKIKNRNLNLFDVIKKLKQLKLLNKFKKPVINDARKAFLEKIKNDNKMRNIISKFSNLLPKINDKNNKNKLKNYFLKWKNKNDILTNRENKFGKAIDLIDKKMTKNDKKCC